MWEGVEEGVGVVEGVELRVGVKEGVRDEEGDKDGVKLGVGVKESVPEGDGETEPLGTQITFRSLEFEYGPTGRSATKIVPSVSIAMPTE